MKVLGLGDNVFDSYDNLGIAYPGGNAVNVAVSASRLGHEASYLGRVADDLWGERLLGALKAERVDAGACEIVPGGTTKLCHQDRIDGERHFKGVELGEAWPGAPVPSGPAVEYACGFDAILTSCNAKVDDWLPLFDGRQGVLSYDFGEKDKYRTPENLAKIAPHIDLAQFSMSGTDQAVIDEFLAGWQFDCPVLVTRGSLPPLLSWDGGRVHGVAAAGDAVDTMGAGDSFVTALVTSLVEEGWRRGAPLPEASRLEDALAAAAAHAARMCQVEGAFGHAARDGEVRAVVFDMDGVIIESEPLYLAIIDDFLTSRGATKLTEGDRNAMYGCTTQIQNMTIAKHLDETAEEIAPAVTAYFAAHRIDYREALIPGIRELLTWLHEEGIAVGLASSSSMPEIRQMLDECELGHAFDAVVTGDDFEESKPNPEIYLHTFGELGCQPGEAVVVEDSEYGITAGRRAGAEVVALCKTHGNISDRDATLAFDTHQEILEYLKRRIGESK